MRLDVISSPKGIKPNSSGSGKNTAVKIVAPDIHVQAGTIFYRVKTHPLRRSQIFSSEHTGMHL